MSNNSNGMTFGGALGLLFIGLKLGGIIQWNWWWVLSPFWISLVIFSLIIGGIFVFAILGRIIFGKNQK